MNMGILGTILRRSSLAQRRPWARLSADRSGNVLAITAAALPIVVGAMGLGVDFTQWVLWKRNLQGAADTAAVAAAVGLDEGVSWTNVQSDAVRLINSNSSNIRIPRTITSVTRQLTPGQVLSTGQTAATHGTSVEVVLQANGVLSFASLFLTAPPTIKTRALAGPRGAGTTCFLALGVAPSYDNANALEIKDMAVNGAGCGFHSNSSHTSSSLLDHGGGSFSALKVSAVGGITGVGGQVKPSAPAMADPYGSGGRNLQAPSGSVEVDRCPGKVCPFVGLVRKMTPPGSGQCIRNNDGSNFTINQPVTWDPGVYLFCANSNGGTDNILKLDDGAQTGNGIAIVLRDGMRMEVNGNVALNLKAMSTTQAATLYPSDAARRALAGILFWQIHESDAADKPNIITGNTTATNLMGAFYSPHSGFELHGNLGTQGCMQMVAERVLMDGSSASITLNDSCAALSGNDPAFTHFGPGKIFLAE